MTYTRKILARCILVNKNTTSLELDETAFDSFCSTKGRETGYFTRYDTVYMIAHLFW